jgi:hypothetical protein
MTEINLFQHVLNGRGAHIHITRLPAVLSEEVQSQHRQEVTATSRRGSTVGCKANFYNLRFQWNKNAKQYRMIRGDRACGKLRVQLSVRLLPRPENEQGEVSGSHGDKYKDDGLPKCCFV